MLMLIFITILLSLLINDVQKTIFYKLHQFYLKFLGMIITALIFSELNEYGNWYMECQICLFIWCLAAVQVHLYLIRIQKALMIFEGLINLQNLPLMIFKLAVFSCSLVFIHNHRLHCSVHWKLKVNLKQHNLKPINEKLAQLHHL